jgi:hypothetical protein
LFLVLVHFARRKQLQPHVRFLVFSFVATSATPARQHYHILHG